MPLELIENEIRRFLASSEPEVICISGHWGVGKTFAWKRHLQESKTNNAIALRRYSYVSLFGVNSLDDLKYSIFENTVGSSDVGIEPSLETFQTNTTAVAKHLGRKSVRFLQQLPIVKNYVGSLGPAWYLSVKEMVVCLDDIERRGESLTTREILGLVSALKEQKRCKVALILNDEALEAEKSEFRKYYEKVVDVSLAYSPSAAECVDIALDKSSKASTLLAQHCIMLGISNIRLIKRIERSVLAIAKLLNGYDEKVLETAVQSLALLGWSVYEPSSAPSVEFLGKQGLASGLDDKKSADPPEKEVAWRALLRAYGFTHLDEFDRVLLDGTRNGFFDALAVQTCATTLDKEIKAEKLNNSFRKAWDIYHDSFDDNQDSVLDAMYDSFLKSAEYITPMNMNSTVSLFKALGRPVQAQDLIRTYVESRAGDRKFFDFRRNYSFSGDVTDPDVIKAFDEQVATLKETSDPAATLRRMASTHGWNPEDITQLSSLSTDEYYHLFKDTRGDDLRKMINTCLQFDRTMNATSDMNTIARRAREALARIGKESPINARRVKGYGIELDENPTGAAPDRTPS